MSNGFKVFWRNCLLTVLGFFALVTNVYGAVELTLWEQEKTEDQKLLDELIQSFEAANKGVKVKRSHYKTEDLRTQYQIAALGNSGADLLLAPNDFAGPFSIMGIIQPVQSWADLKRFNPAVLQAITDSAGTWGVPVSSGNHLMLFINKKIIKKVPETIEEMVAVAKEVTDPAQKRYGLAYNLNEPFWFVAFLGAYGEKPLVNHKPQLDTKGMVAALDLVKGFKHREHIVPQDCDYACAETLFIDGKAGMLINGDWAVTKYEEELGENLLIRPLPRLQATGKHMAPFTSGKYLLFNRSLKGDRLKAAKKFTQFMVSEKVQKILVERSRKLPVLISMKDHDVLKKFPVLNSTMQAMTYGTPMPMAVEMRAVWDAIRPQLQLVMAGKVKPEQAVKVMQKDALTKIQEMSE